MTTTVGLLTSTLEEPELAGHLWVYLNWALGFRDLGCEVLWLELPGRDRDHEGQREYWMGRLDDQLARHGLAGALRVDADHHEAVDRVDLLVNFLYNAPGFVSHCRRSALVDIDPGLLQTWVALEQIQLAPHDVYFTTGETVGTPAARFPDCGLRWLYAPPAVHLPSWPVVDPVPGAAYTTVSTWWSDDWLVLDGEPFDNTKRRSFLEVLDLPSRVDVPLELALCLGGTEVERQDAALLDRHGWRIREARSVSDTPTAYRSYLQGSRGEFSCAKPSCGHLANAWISDRTLCYLASGRPAVVQHTGPSRYLPDRAGLLRFRDVDHAAQLITRAESDYEPHAKEARALTEAHFDATNAAAGILERAL